MALPKPATKPHATLMRHVFGGSLRFKVMDIGASSRDGNVPPYYMLLDAGDVDLIGFEPDQEALTKLNASKKNNAAYLPHIVGDGKRHTFRWCLSPGMSSLLQPNENVLNLLHAFPGFAKVVSTSDVETVRLDDLPETAGTEFIKIDVQGGELIVMGGALQRLKDVLAIQIEVNFLPMYKGQPLFADIDAFMRQHGFALHRFVDTAERALCPLSIDKNPFMPGSQAMWADVVYVRDLTRLDELTDRQLLVLATIAHGICASFDLAAHLLRAHDVRRGSQLATRYAEALRPYYGVHQVDLMAFIANP